MGKKTANSKSFGQLGYRIITALITIPVLLFVLYHLVGTFLFFSHL